MATFAKEFIDFQEQFTKKLAYWSWGLFFVSVVCGAWTLLAFAGEISAKKGDGDSIPSAWSWNIRGPAIGQMSTFLLGLLLTIFLAVKAMK